jgi:hypothetical protein
MIKNLREGMYVYSIVTRLWFEEYRETKKRLESQKKQLVTIRLEDLKIETHPDNYEPLDY